MRVFQIFDMDNDGKMTKDELRCALLTDGSGKMTHDEVCPITRRENATLKIQEYFWYLEELQKK